MAQGIFLDRSNVIEVKVEDDYYHVRYGFHEFACFHKDDAAAKRVIVVQLVIMGVSKAQIARAFDVHRSSIYFWKETYEEGGMQTLVSLEKGPEAKLTEAVKDYIYALYKNLKGERKFRNKIAEEVKKRKPKVETAEANPHKTTKRRKRSDASDDS